MISDECDRELMTTVMEMIWDISSHEVLEIVKGIHQCIDQKLLSITNVLAAIDKSSIWNLHHMKKYMELCSILAEKYDINTLKFYQNQILQALLVKASYIRLPLPIKYKNSSIDEIYPVYPSNSLQKAILWDDLNDFCRLSSQPGFDYNQKINFTSLIDLAATFGSIEIFKFLYMNHANITQTTLENAILGNDYEIIHICERHVNILTEMCMNNAIKSHNYELVEYLNSNNGLEIPIHRAIENFNFKVFFNYFKTKNCIDRSLISAVQTNLTSIADFLIPYGANIEITDETMQTPLHIAVKQGNYKMVKILLKNKANINAIDDQNQTALIIATKNNCTKSVKLLLKFKADISIRDKYDHSALDYAKENKFYQICHLLRASQVTNLDHKSEINNEMKKVTKICADIENIEGIACYE